MMNPKKKPELPLAGLVALLLLAGFVGLDSEAAVPHKLKLEAGPTYIKVERATPGGDVFLIGYEQTVREYSRVFRRVEKEAVASPDGTALIDLGRGLASRSFWVVIDLTSASFAAVTADGSKVREGEFLATSFGEDSSGKRRKASARFDYVHALLVRPGGGSWELTAGDGGPSDADANLDGHIELTTEKFARKKNARSDAGEYRKGDLLILFVPRQMGYLVAEVPE